MVLQVVLLALWLVSEFLLSSLQSLFGFSGDDTSVTRAVHMARALDSRSPEGGSDERRIKDGCRRNLIQMEMMMEFDCKDRTWGAIPTNRLQASVYPVEGGCTTIPLMQTRWTICKGKLRHKSITAHNTRALLEQSVRCHPLLLLQEEPGFTRGFKPSH